jgi:hypothetical protein
MKKYTFEVLIPYFDTVENRKLQLKERLRVEEARADILISAKNKKGVCLVKLLHISTVG